MKINKASLRSKKKTKNLNSPTLGKLSIVTSTKKKKSYVKATISAFHLFILSLILLWINLCCLHFQLISFQLRSYLVGESPIISSETELFMASTVMTSSRPELYVVGNSRPD